MYDRRVPVFDREGVDMRRITARFVTVVATGLVAGAALTGVAAAHGPSGDLDSALVTGAGGFTNVGGEHGVTTGGGAFLSTAGQLY
jgi:hypothetical protein